MNQRLACAALLVVLFALAACSDRNNQGAATVIAADSDALPVPADADGSVTGMPDAPGPGHIGPPEAGEAETLTSTPAEDGADPSLADGASSGSVSIDDAPDPMPMFEGPGPAEAVALVRAYYEAINAGDFSRALGLWSDGGKASGQSPQQFTDGFAGTRAVSVDILPPGRIGSAAGSRYIEVPLALSATQNDGNVRNYVGAYTLRRTVGDGATPEQHGWRIASADIREVRP